MRTRIKTGVLVASSSKLFVKKNKVHYQYVEKLFGNVIIKTIIK